MVRTLHIGLGTIGREIISACMSGDLATPAAGVDIDPDLAGAQLADLLPGAPDGAVIYPDIQEALEDGDYDCAVLSTASFIPDIRDDLETLIAAGLDVVSTTEELSYPQLQHPDAAAALDDAAKSAGVTVVGTGVNPGFVLDLLPALMTRPCVQITRVEAARVVDTGRRRRQLQLKVGAGMEVEAFNQLAEDGKIGHVGLLESLALVARAAGWPVDVEAVEHRLEPVVAEEDIASDEVCVEAGQVAGAQETVKLQPEPGTAIEIFLRMSLGEPEEYDEVRIEGMPPISLRIEGGIHGDVATAGCTANVIAPALRAPAGLLTVLDLPIC